MTSGQPSIRILVVDDHPIIRQGIGALVATQSDMSIIAEASNGREALELTRNRLPDLVFLDLQMPTQDGFSVIRELRNDDRFRELPVIAITANAMLGLTQGPWAGLRSQALRYELHQAGPFEAAQYGMMADLQHSQRRGGAAQRVSCLICAP